MIERCVSGLMVPECSCTTCLVAMIDTHAPDVRLGDRRVTGERAATPEREDPEAMVL